VSTPVPKSGDVGLSRRSPCGLCTEEWFKVPNDCDLPTYGYAFWVSEDCPVHWNRYLAQVTWIEEMRREQP